MGTLLSISDDSAAIALAETRRAELELERLKYQLRQDRPVEYKIAKVTTFSGKREHWVSFRENILDDLGMAGFSRYLKDDFVIDKWNIEGNKRLYHMFAKATNQGSTSHLVKAHKINEDGRAAWRALVDWYEGTVESREIQKLTRTQLFALRLYPKQDANNHINKFIKYKDELELIGKGEQESTLIDTFLDSIIDTKYAIPVGQCRLSSTVTLQQCFDAIRTYSAIIDRESIRNQTGPTIRRVVTEEDEDKEGKPKYAFRTPEEWSQLTSDERKEILQMRANFNKRKNKKNGGANKRARRAGTEADEEPPPSTPVEEEGVAEA